VKKRLFLLICLFSTIVVYAKDKKWEVGFGTGLSLLEYHHIGQSGPVGLKSFAFLPELIANYSSGKKVHEFSFSLPKFSNWEYTDSGDPTGEGTDMLIAEMLWKLKWRLGRNEERAVQFYAGPVGSFLYRNWNNAFEGGITKKIRLMALKGGGVVNIIYRFHPGINIFAEGIIGGYGGRFNSFSDNEFDSSGPETGIFDEFALGLNWSPLLRFTLTPYYKYGSFNDYNNLYSLNFKESVIEIKLRYSLGYER